MWITVPPYLLLREAGWLETERDAVPVAPVRAVFPYASLYDRVTQAKPPCI